MAIENKNMKWACPICHLPLTSNGGLDPTIPCPHSNEIIFGKSSSPMSTKKEKCCGCPEKQDLCRGECICHHPQSESIEWEKEFDDTFTTVETAFMSDSVIGRTLSKEIKLFELKSFIQSAITTAVAKRELEIAEGVKGKVYSGELSETDSNTVLSIIKH